MAAPRVLDPKEANARYHDAAAASYDAKWAISLDEPSRSYVARRAGRMLPAGHYGRVLEVGCGTGFWILNLWQSGYVGRAHATDISEGMLAACATNAEGIGCPIALRPADAERLPYEDGSFDLVTGHAFLHHLPEPRAALREIHRVLAPGGAMLIAGEPTRAGDRLAGVAKRSVLAAFRAASALPAVRALGRPPPPAPATDDERILRDLEFAVDLHTFEPAEVAAWARAEGFTGVRVETEELLSSLAGWAVRTFEAQVRPGLLGPRWGRFAYRTYLALYRIDEALYRAVPRRLFYNLLLYGERPPGG
ncbi:MAG TPA: class I SAM-dependent methyltransferase [Actinomycetota bacterium]|nr:class I SAM-dependent methyltransferase [Actinomycetota bacterium]